MLSTQDAAGGLPAASASLIRRETLCSKSAHEVATRDLSSLGVTAISVRRHARSFAVSRNSMAADRATRSSGRQTWRQPTAATKLTANTSSAPPTRTESGSSMHVRQKSTAPYLTRS